METESTLNPLQPLALPTDTDQDTSWKPLFPLARVKQIMKLDPKVNTTIDGVYAVTSACQMFLEMLVQESNIFTLKDGIFSFNVGTF